jgi:protein arginine N-methyltransferase 5
VTPIMAGLLYERIRMYKKAEFLETPFVVKFRASKLISGLQSLWSFEHPTKKLKYPLGHPNFNKHNTRYQFRSFEVSEDVIMVLVRLN